MGTIAKIALWILSIGALFGAGLATFVAIQEPWLSWGYGAAAAMVAFAVVLNPWTAARSRLPTWLRALIAVITVIVGYAASLETGAQAGRHGAIEEARIASEAFNEGVVLSRRKDAASSAAAEEQFAIACARRVAEGCYNQALMIAKQPGQSRAPELVPLYNKACVAGHQNACSNLALQLIDRGGGGTERAVRLLKTGCDKGHALSCQNLAVQFARGEGVAKDDSQARALVAKACAAGREEACRISAQLRAGAQP